jgi:hypothetical protein
LKQEILKEHLKEKRQFLTQTVKRAEEKGDETALHSALEELSQLSSAPFES